MGREGAPSADDRSANMEEASGGLKGPKSRPEWSCPCDRSKIIKMLSFPTDNYAM